MYVKIFLEKIKMNFFLELIILKTMLLFSFIKFFKLAKMFSITISSYYNLFLEWVYQNFELTGDLRYKLEHYNSESFDPYSYYVISLRSKALLKFLLDKKNNLGDPLTINQKIKEFEQHNEILKRVSLKLHEKFNPSTVYSFNDQFHLIFNKDCSVNKRSGDLNVNKNLTTITSFLSVCLTKELLNQGIDLDFTYSAKWMRFNNHVEAFSYLKFRQDECRDLNMEYFISYKSNDSPFNMGPEPVGYMLYGNLLKELGRENLFEIVLQNFMNSDNKSHYAIIDSHNKNNKRKRSRSENNLEYKEKTKIFLNMDLNENDDNCKVLV